MGVFHQIEEGGAVREVDARLKPATSSGPEHGDRVLGARARSLERRSKRILDDRGERAAGLRRVRLRVAEQCVIETNRRSHTY